VWMVAGLAPARPVPSIPPRAQPGAGAVPRGRASRRQRERFVAVTCPLEGWPHAAASAPPVWRRAEGAGRGHVRGPAGPGDEYPAAVIELRFRTCMRHRLLCIQEAGTHCAHCGQSRHPRIRAKCHPRRRRTCAGTVCSGRGSLHRRSDSAVAVTCSLEAWPGMAPAHGQSLLRARERSRGDEERTRPGSPRRSNLDRRAATTGRQSPR
jgi:hypothetical protein